MNAWFENIRFWKEIEPWMFRKSSWDSASLQIDKIISLLKLKKGDKVLDLACGPGRHTLELSRRGYQVTGVDLMDYYLEKVRAKSLSEGLNIELIQSDMRKFTRSNHFDAVINMATSFGYFQDKKDDQKVMQNIFVSLKDRGRLLMDMIGKEIVHRNFVSEADKEEAGMTLKAKVELVQNGTLLNIRNRLQKGKAKYELAFSQRLYAASELRNLLSDCGFKEVNIYGDLDGSPYGNQAQRLVAVAYKRN